MALLGMTARAQSTAEAAGGYKVEENLLGTFYWSAQQDMFPSLQVVSADGRHVAYAAAYKKDCPDISVYCIFVDGKPIALPQGAELSNLALSPDGTRMAYVVYGPGKTGARLVLDGKEGPEFRSYKYGNVFADTLIFSPDGKRFAYVAKKEPYPPHASSRVIGDGEAGAEFEQVANVTLSPDSQRVAYAGKTGKHWTPVVDGRPGAECDEIVGPIFSPDSRRVMYACKLDKKWSVVTDGQASPVYDDFVAGSIDANAITVNADFSPKEHLFVAGSVGRDQLYTAADFSPDSEHLAYAAKRNGKWVMVVDGKAGDEYEQIGIGSPAFSPDGKRMAFLARTDRSLEPWRAVADGQVGTGVFPYPPSRFQSRWQAFGLCGPKWVCSKNPGLWWWMASRARNTGISASTLTVRMGSIWPTRRRCASR